MRNFKDYLKEKADIKSNFLYHSTNFKSALNILKHNYFRTSINAETGKSGLSTTTDKKYIWGSNEVRFVIDHKKISNKYKTIPIESIVGIDESEVLVLNEGAITNANKYIKEIQYNENKYMPKNFIDEIEDYSKKFKVKINKTII